MTFAMELLEQAAYACLQLLMHPFFYIGILFLVLQYRRQIRMERRLFYTKLHSMLDQTWRSIAIGFAAGFIGSIFMVWIGAVIRPEMVLFLWLISICMIFIRVRYICFAYAVGVVGIIQSLSVFVPASVLNEYAWIRTVFEIFTWTSLPALFVLVAILHVFEGILLRWQGARNATPVFYASKRGKIVGGYQFQSFWPIPLLLVVPAIPLGSDVMSLLPWLTMHSSSLSLPWTPLFGGQAWSQGWSVLALPVMIGFTDQTLAFRPQIKVKKSANLLFIYSGLLIVCSVLVYFFPVFGLLASFLCILFHEIIVWLSRRQEFEASPHFVHNREGLMVLAVLPGSPAAELGIELGEKIKVVNGTRVTTREELHEAIQQNAAFCKLEVVNLEGHSKFLQRAIYANEHHQLGLILAPDERTLYYVDPGDPGLISTIKAKVSGLFASDSRHTM